MWRCALIILEVVVRRGFCVSCCVPVGPNPGSLWGDEGSLGPFWDFWTSHVCPSGRSIASSGSGRSRCQCGRLRTPGEVSLDSPVRIYSFISALLNTIIKHKTQGKCLFYIFSLKSFLTSFEKPEKNYAKFWAKNAQLKEQIQAPQGSVLVWKSVEVKCRLLAISLHLQPTHSDAGQMVTGGQKLCQT